jgi:tetratricopeptide (TPR) repeat protein
VKNRLKLGAGLSFIGSFGMLNLAAPAVLAIAHPVSMMAQAAAATVHGLVKDPGGIPLHDGIVKFTTDLTVPAKDRTYKYSAPIDADGTYKATGIPAGDYLMVVFRGDVSADFQRVTIKAADDKTVDFDMSRPEYIAALTPEQRKDLEEAKKKNAAVLAENAKIGNVNKTLVQARADEKSGKADAAVTELTPLTAAMPNEPIVWAALGEAQLAEADAARAAATDKKDPAVLQKYADAAASYQKALDTNAAAKKPSADIAFTSDLNMGQAFGRSGKPDEAAAAYEAAAKADPTKAGVAYYNEAAVYYNAQKLKEAAVAADKAIAIDPKRPETWYIKASALIPDAKAVTDPKTKLTTFELPPGCLEAYQEYLELAPTGPHAQDIKDLLTNLKQPMKNSFKAKR